ncbi:MAG: YncE family protein [Bacteroidales bacterium]
MKKLTFSRVFIFLLLGNLILISGCKSHKITQPQPVDQSAEYFLKGFVYSEKYLDISNETENARATFWKPDGTIIFITGRYTDNVAAYKLREPWQIHTAEFLHDINLPGENQHGLYFREDGKLMWVFDRTSIWSFTLETAWDITTRSEGANHDLNHFVQRGHDIDFKPDGTILFIDDRNAGAIYEYTLSTPWDVYTGALTYTLDISVQQIEVRGVEFLQDGRIMMLMDTGRDEILHYNLAEPWNISTAVFFDTFDVSSQTYQGRGLSFSSDETIIYVTCREKEKIFQYELIKK